MSGGSVPRGSVDQPIAPAPAGLPEVELAPGYAVPRVIVGCWQLAADHGGRAFEGSALDGLLALARAGFRAFDCADIYTGVEEILGEARRQWRAGSPEAPPLRIHTKFVPDRELLPRLRRAHVQRAIDRSLARLGVERLDLVQFHWWDYEVPGYVEAALWLEELRLAGKIRHVGVTNFDVPRLRELVEAGVAPVAHQVQYSLLDRRPDDGMAAFCAQQGIGLICYGALAGGYLSERYLGLGESEGAPANRSQVKYRLIVDEAGGWEALQDYLRCSKAIAEKHGVGVAQVAARFCLDQPGVSAVLLGASPRVLETASRELFDLRLDEEDRAGLTEVRGAHPGPEGDVYELERRPGGRHSAILRTDLGGHR